MIIEECIYISKYLRPLENADDNNGFYLNNICQRNANEKRKKKLREKGSKKIDFIDSCFFLCLFKMGLPEVYLRKKNSSAFIRRINHRCTQCLDGIYKNIPTL